jgi:NAD(P)-dependent dehydrogenase (short-subunit alcohol dehydrogenase family)
MQNDEIITALDQAPDLAQGQTDSHALARNQNTEHAATGHDDAVQIDKQRPTPPQPEQKLDKPGKEADLQLKPQFLAEGYQGSGKLRDQVALITGGDSGIGRAVAVLFAREGANVAIVYVSDQEREDAEQVRQQVETEGRLCLLIRGDVKDYAFCEEAVKNTVEAFGKLDILVNNAAFQQHVEEIGDLSEEQFDKTFRTNIYGYFYMCKAAVPVLKNGASIINTSSVTGLAGSKKLLDYSATKGAINAFTKSLASQLIEKGIRVNAIAPGPVWTPLNPADQPPEAVAQFGSQTDMKRPAQPDEMSPAFVFLAANCCSSYITGIVLPITGSVSE